MFYRAQDLEIDRVYLEDGACKSFHCHDPHDLNGRSAPLVSQVPIAAVKSKLKIRVLKN